jgi:hypothetical protein
MARGQSNTGAVEFVAKLLDDEALVVSVSGEAGKLI